MVTSLLRAYKFIYPKLIFLCLALGISNLWAQDFSENLAIKEVPVSVQKRDELRQLVPQVIDVFSAEELRHKTAYTIDALVLDIPAVLVAKGYGIDTLFVRGRGSMPTPGFAPAVGIYLDGFLRGKSHLNSGLLLDVDRVEVIKGVPALYTGEHSLAGTMNIIANLPVDDFEGTFGFHLATPTQESRVDFSLNAPVDSYVKMRFAGQVFNSEGFVEHPNEAATVGLDSQGSAFRYTSTLSLTKELKTQFKLFYNTEKTQHPRVAEVIRCDPSADDGIYNSCFAHQNTENITPFDNQLDYKFQQGMKDFLKLENIGVFLQTDYRYNAKNLSTNISLIQDNNQRFEDLDSGELDILHRNNYQSIRQLEIEVLLKSDSDGLVDWFIGASGRFSKIDFDEHILPNHIDQVQAMNLKLEESVVGNRNVHYIEKSSWGLYGSVKFYISNYIRLQLGIRSVLAVERYDYISSWGTYSDKNLSASSFELQRDFFRSEEVFGVDTNFNSRFKSQIITLPTALFEYDINGDALLFFSYAAGIRPKSYDFKLDNFANRHSSSVVDSEVENGDSIELGVKSLWIDRSMRINLALFYNQFSDVQVQSFDQNTFLPQLDNNAELLVTGIDLEFTSILSRGLAFQSKGTFLSSEYSSGTAACSTAQILAQSSDCELVDDSNPLLGGNQNLAGKSTPFAPTLSSSFALIYSTKLSNSLSLRAIGDVTTSSSYYLQHDLDSNTLVDAHTLFGLRIEILHDADNWDMALIAKNLTDEKIPFYCEDLPTAPGSYRCGLNPPATIAIQGHYRW